MVLWPGFVQPWDTGLEENICALCLLTSTANWLRIGEEKTYTDKYGGEEPARRHADHDIAG